MQLVFVRELDAKTNKGAGSLRKHFVSAFAIAAFLSLGAQLAHAQASVSAAPAPVANLASEAKNFRIRSADLYTADGLRLILAQATPAAAPIEPQPAPGGPVAAPPPEPRFNIDKFTVHGATLITAEGLQLILAPYIGKNKSFGDVQKALEALEKTYTSKGYSAVQVILPEQQIEDGDVEFNIVEAKIGKVVVEGNHYYNEANVRASMPRLQEGQPPNIFEISDNLRVANENPAKQTTVLLRSGTEEGQVDAVLRVADERPNKISLTLDNTGTQQTGLFRVGLGYQNANMWNRDHVLNMQYVSAPHDDVNAPRIVLHPNKNVFILGLQYRIPLYKEGDSLEFSAGHSNVNSGLVANLFNISGSGSIFGARYNHNLQKIGDLEHKLSYTLDWRAYRSVVTQVDVAGFGLVPDVTVHPIGLTYAGVYRKSESESNFYVSVSQNLPGGNDAGTNAFLGDAITTIPARPPARAGANPRYFITRWGFNHNRALPRDWQLRWGMSGQVTRDMLISGEQFGIGGVDSVRGFLEREIINDNGYRGTFEVYTPDFGGIVPITGVRMRALTFYDWGAVKRNRPDVLEIHRQHIGSVGLGLRISRGTNVSIRLDAATVMDSGGLQKIGDVRAHMSLAYIF
ncbi:MAG: ShlB/FhaC/HecB family hemolysin secretion/activation protein [Burkholderiales bacterium]|nr:ShlB/FhaC/HecB family hemolysin secretion/activation protein [Burkholderiales bacterium]